MNPGDPLRMNRTSRTRMFSQNTPPHLHREPLQPPATPDVYTRTSRTTERQPRLEHRALRHHSVLRDEDAQNPYRRSHSWAAPAHPEVRGEHSAPRARTPGHVNASTSGGRKLIYFRDRAELPWLSAPRELLRGEVDSFWVPPDAEYLVDYENPTDECFWFARIQTSYPSPYDTAHNQALHRQHDFL